MKKQLTLILAALLLASSMTACGNGTAKETNMAETKAPETKAPETVLAETDAVGTNAPETSTSETNVGETNAPETDNPWADTETVRNDKSAFSLASLTTSVGLEIRENQLYITSLVTESGVEKITAPAAYAFPSYYAVEGEGDMEFAWAYSGYTAYNDGDGGLGYTFLFHDETAAATLKVTVVARPDMAGPFEFFAYLENNTEGVLLVIPEEFFSLAVDGESAPTTWSFAKESGTAEGYHHWDGFYRKGTGIYQVELSDGVTDIVSNSVDQNWNQSGHIPMMYVDYGTNGIYYALEWTNGSLTAEGLGDGGARLSACLVEQDYFYTNLPSGTSLYLPSVYLGAYDGDVDVGSNVFKHWFLRYKAPDNMLEDENEPLTQQDMQLGIDVAKYGIQQIKWDYGCWSDELVSDKSSWRTNEGLLEVRNSAYLSVMQSVGASTLAEFVQKAKEAGVNVTTYVLLKDTEMDREGVPTSVGEHGHPEWFSNICITGVGDSADLGNEECVEFYKDYLYNFFSSTGVNTWRSDFEPICRSSDQENRHGVLEYDVQYWATIGFRDLVDHLLNNIDGFRYESCSSGGSMKDFFTMTKASIINCDDSANFMSLHMSFYDSSYCIHPAQIQLPCNAMSFTPGAQYYYGIGDYDYGFRTMLTGGVMLSNWTGTTAEDISYWEKYIPNIYNKLMKPLIRYGDLYHILPRPDGIHWDGLEYIDADSENEIKGLVMLWKPTNEEGPEKTIKLRGLEAETMYQLTFEDRPEQNCTKTGAELMETGLTVTIEGESGSEMIWISEAK